MPLTTTIGIEDDAALLADVVRVSPHVDAAPKVSTYQSLRGSDEGIHGPPGDHD